MAEDCFKVTTITGRGKKLLLFDVKPDDLLKQVLVIISSIFETFLFFWKKNLVFPRHEPIQKRRPFKVLNNKHTFRKNHLKNK